MNKLKLLSKINGPEDIKTLNIVSLKDLSTEVCVYIDEIIKKIGGHYSSPLGVVDLTLALHYVYDMPIDNNNWTEEFSMYSASDKQ